MSLQKQIKDLENQIADIYLGDGQQDWDVCKQLEQNLADLQKLALEDEKQVADTDKEQVSNSDCEKHKIQQDEPNLDDTDLESSDQSEADIDEQNDEAEAEELPAPRLLTPQELKQLSEDSYKAHLKVGNLNNNKNKTKNLQKDQKDFDIPKTKFSQKRFGNKIQSNFQKIPKLCDLEVEPPAKKSHYKPYPTGEYQIDTNKILKLIRQDLNKYKPPIFYSGPPNWRNKRGSSNWRNSIPNWNEQGSSNWYNPGQPNWNGQGSSNWHNSGRGKKSFYHQQIENNFRPLPPATINQREGRPQTANYANPGGRNWTHFAALRGKKNLRKRTNE